MKTEMNIDNRHKDAICTNESEKSNPVWHNIKYLIIGIAFGVVFVKAEIISWFRIQEMFRLQSFFMYGVIGTAVVTGMISIWLIKRYNIKKKFRPTKSVNYSYPTHSLNSVPMRFVVVPPPSPHSHAISLNFFFFFAHGIVGLQTT